MRDHFDDLVEGLDPAEQERLRNVHELLVEAGPPPELSLRLAKLPAGVTEPRTIPFPQVRRRFAGTIALAAALAAAVFGGGYLAGAQHGGGPRTVRVAAMTGSNALASLRVGAADSGGNYPIDFTVKGLAKDTQYSFYEVFLLRNGKPSYPCGGFRVGNGTTTTKRFWVPYAVTAATKWVVTEIDKGHAWPGRTVMTMT